MSQLQHNRFKDAPWFPTEDTYVLIGGSGGIGSWLTLLLARANFKPIIFDFDTIEEHNIGGQLFSVGDIGSPKVVATSRIAKQFANTEVMANNQRYDKDSMSHHYVFSGFDNMKARRDMFDNFKKYVDQWKDDVKGGTALSSVEPIFIDGRLLMEQLTIFCVTPDKIDEYEKHMFEDSEIEEAPCTLKQTSHSAAMIASHMVGFFTNHITNNNEGEKDRALPFRWEYFIPINLITEE